MSIGRSAPHWPNENIVGMPNILKLKLRKFRDTSMINLGASVFI
ncbi:MAG: hypothetical protein K0S30_2316 [Clostridia bacterium]|jgi:hypothetical protein|nr:hypothetical protein [Clostridia bacterium]